MFNLTKEELVVLRKLNTSHKIQDFLNNIPTNYEKKGETCLSPRLVLRLKKAHCMEGAMLAALALRVQGQKPLVVDLTASKEDLDHVITVFKKNGYWGAISKTNHAVLRYREPIYKSIRELVMSYVHEYVNDDGKKTLRSYSLPVDLRKFDNRDWMTSEKDVWFIPKHLEKVKHYPLMNKKQVNELRIADKIEINAGKLVEW